MSLIRVYNIVRTNHYFNRKLHVIDWSLKLLYCCKLEQLMMECGKNEGLWQL